MKTVIFNIYDVALLLAAGECGLLAIWFFAHQGARPIRHILLAVFLILNALIAVHIVNLWGEVRYVIFDFAPNVFFIFTFAYFLQGPVLYWYTKSLLYKDFTFKPLDALHLIPTLATPVYLYFVYYRHTLDIKRGLALDFKSYALYDFNFHPFVHAQKIIVVIYGVMCLYQLLRYRILLKNNYSNIEKIDFTWLLLLIGGFLLVWVWFLVTHIAGQYVALDISDTLGVVGTYLIFVLINILAVYGMLYSNVFEGIKAEDEQSQLDTELIDPDYVERVRDALEVDKLFLNPRLTLEELADHVKLAPRLVSTIINRSMNKNFHEFVNHYRVEEAKRILSDIAHKDQSVLDVALIAGFNSKATFNRFFKKFTKLTPSEFRDKHLI